MFSALTPADRAVLALGVGVAVWDVACPAGETISEAAGRYHARWPWPTRAVVAVLGLHLLGLLPGWFDPFHAVTRLKGVG